MKCLWGGVDARSEVLAGSRVSNDSTKEACIKVMPSLLGRGQGNTAVRLRMLAPRSWLPKAPVSPLLAPRSLLLAPRSSLLLDEDFIVLQVGEVLHLAPGIPLHVPAAPRGWSAQCQLSEPCPNLVSLLQFGV